ncbi:MAG: HAD-IIA family hydrolase [Acidimicrobiales bacterium]
MGSDLSAWVIDLDGVVWIGDRPIPGAAEAIAALVARGDDVVFVTNMSRLTVADQEAKLGRAGIEAGGRVITSAMAAGSLVHPGERVLVVGGDGIAEAVEANGATPVDDGDADAVIVGLHPDFAYDDAGRAMRAVRAGARFIGTNHDPTYPTPDGLQPGGGALVAMIAYAAEVDPVLAGKPNRPVADLVRQRLGDDGVVVGDRADSDGLFARELGYDFVLVMSGVTTPEDLPVEPEPAHVFADLAEAARTL